MWKSLLIPDDILISINDLGFEEPTPIQQQVIPIAIRDYVDILGSAPTVLLACNLLDLVLVYFLFYALFCLTLLHQFSITILLPRLFLLL